MKSIARLVAPALVLPALLWSPPLAAQRGDVEKKAFEDREAGYRLKTPKDWAVTPVAPDARADGMAFQADPPEHGGPDRGHFRVVLATDQADFLDWVETILCAVAEKRVKLEDLKAELDEQQAAGAAQARHLRWLFGGVYADAWLIEHAPSKVGVIGTVAEADKYAKSWLAAFERSARSFEAFAPVVAAAGTGGNYADKLARARAEAERTAGWRVLPTPSQKFILTTSCDNQKFLNEVIDRLERSRKVFEEDYPPPADFAHVSIVRVCASEEDFHRYGGTDEGTMGWFNPDSTELVLFDAKEIDRNMSYAVMTHEAFHQYCHFLFGRSEAHRWFDEGHGDYYGGMKFDGQKPKITAHMPGGLDRQPVIREMLQLDTAKPLTEHLNFDHGQWQNQGPSNVACYAQSWSVVYMLRQGMLGNVNPKVWRKEYAQILPAYIETLRKGFEEAYRVERERRAKAGSQEGTNGEVIELDSSDLGGAVVKKIWKEAMDASWGKIDLVQFQEDWKLYVKKFLKD